MEDLVAAPVARKPTPRAMPAPPPDQLETSDRESHDDLEHLMELQRLERERAQLLVQLQDAEEAKGVAEREARKYREMAPAVIFPPKSLPPPTSHSLPPPALQQAVVEGDIEVLKKAVMKTSLGRASVTLGILIALGWNAFNTVRSAIPIKKAEAVQARQAQTEQLSAEEIKQRVLESERNYLRWRATYCYLKQLRGASARQGLDLPSLPPGGVKALRLGDEDPNRPGPPRFVAEEVCPEFPALPPETSPH